jgi:hypothetical protein
MKLEPKPALQATLYLMLLLGLIVLIIALPSWAVAALVLPIVLGCLWWLLYTMLRELHRLKREKNKPSLLSSNAKEK